MGTKTTLIPVCENASSPLRVRALRSAVNRAFNGGTISIQGRTECTTTLIFYDGTQALHVCHSAANKSPIMARNLLPFIAFFIVATCFYAFFVVAYFLFSDSSNLNKCTLF